MRVAKVGRSALLIALLFPDRIESLHSCTRAHTLLEECLTLQNGVCSVRAAFYGADLHSAGLSSRRGCQGSRRHCRSQASGSKAAGCRVFHSPGHRQASL